MTTRLFRATLFFAMAMFPYLDVQRPCAWIGCLQLMGVETLEE